MAEATEILAEIKEGMGGEFIQKIIKICKEVEEAIDKCFFQFGVDGFISLETHDKVFAALDGLNRAFMAIKMAFMAGRELMRCRWSSSYERMYRALVLINKIGGYMFNACGKVYYRDKSDFEVVNREDSEYTEIRAVVELLRERFQRIPGIK